MTHPLKQAMDEIQMRLRFGFLYDEIFGANEMSGFARTGGNKRGKKAPKKPRQHFDPRVQLGIADMKRIFPGMVEYKGTGQLMTESMSQKINRPNDNSHKT